MMMMMVMMMMMMIKLAACMMTESATRPLSENIYDLPSDERYTGIGTIPRY